MTCPFCGAAAIEFGVCIRFECGSWSGGGGDDQSKPCQELCRLREKKAKGLEWEPTCQGKALIAQTPLGYLMVMIFADECLVINRILGEERRSKHATLDAAKAHAEELHQQAWRELRERWDFKGGGK